MKITFRSPKMPDHDNLVDMDSYVRYMLKNPTNECAREIYAKTEMHGRKTVHTFVGCVCMMIACPSLHSLRDLKQICDSGELASVYERVLITDEFKERHGLNNLRLHLGIQDWEYNLCLSELENGETTIYCRQL